MAKTIAGKPGNVAEMASPIRPVSRGHGLQSRTMAESRGSARLRELLSLSVDVPIETLCDEAAQELARLRDIKPAPSVWPAGD